MSWCPYHTGSSTLGPIYQASSVTLAADLDCLSWCCSIASFELEEFETAKGAFEEAAVLDPKLKAVKGWLAQCNKELNSTPMSLV